MRKGASIRHGEVDLKSVRRPGFFGQAPHREPIAERDDRAYVVEFTAPREAYERIHLQRVDPAARVVSGRRRR
jgi:hypothetical protein